MLTLGVRRLPAQPHLLAVLAERGGRLLLRVVANDGSQPNPLLLYVQAM